MHVATAPTWREAKQKGDPPFRRTPQDERTPAARSAQRGFFHVRGRPRRLALRSCYDYVLGLCGRMKDVVVGLLSPLLFRGFAAKPRATLGMDGGLGCCRLFGALLYSLCWMKSPLFLQGCILDL